MVYNLSKQIAKIQVSTLSSTQYMEIFEPGDIALLYLGPHWGPTYFGSTVSNYPWLQKSKSSATPHFYGGVLCELATTAIGVYCQPIGFHSRLGSDWLLGTSTLVLLRRVVRRVCPSSLLSPETITRNKESAFHSITWNEEYRGNRHRVHLFIVLQIDHPRAIQNRETAEWVGDRRAHWGDNWRVDK